MRKFSTITDYYLIVSGSSAPQLKAMSSSVVSELKKEGVSCYRKAGEPEGGWMVLDYAEVVIHIFMNATRSYYAIEELWATAPRLDIPLNHKNHQ